MGSRNYDTKETLCKTKKLPTWVHFMILKNQMLYKGKLDNPISHSYMLEQETSFPSQPQGRKSKSMESKSPKNLSTNERPWWVRAVEMAMASSLRRASTISPTVANFWKLSQSTSAFSLVGVKEAIASWWQAHLGPCDYPGWEGPSQGEGKPDSSQTDLQNFEIPWVSWV